MDPLSPRFFKSEFELSFQGRTQLLTGLVSTTGITKIYFDAGIPEPWKKSLGEVVQVRIGALQLRGVLLFQHVEHGMFYEVKFRDVSPEMLAQIEQRVRTEGVNPGWQRKYPRIPVRGGPDDPELPVPNLCMVRFVGQEIFVNVMNFTLGGIRIETLGDNLAELRVGSVLHFDLITSTGDIMANLSGEVRNIAVHDHVGQQGVALTRSFGLRFLEMDPVNEKKYRNLIRDYCNILQKRMLGEK